MPDSSPWWHLDPIREWDRDGFLPFDEWPVPWRRAVGIAGVIWILGAFAVWIMQENAGALVVVSPYALSGLAYLSAVVADRDRRWRKALSRIQLIGLLLTVVLFVSTLAVALRADP